MQETWLDSEKLYKSVPGVDDIGVGGTWLAGEDSCEIVDGIGGRGGEGGRRCGGDGLLDSIVVEADVSSCRSLSLMFGASRVVDPRPDGGVTLVPSNAFLLS